MVLDAVVGSDYRGQVLSGDVICDGRPLVSHFVVQFDKFLFFLGVPFHSNTLAADVIFIPESISSYRSLHCLALFLGKVYSLDSLLAIVDQLFSPSSSYNLRKVSSYS